MVDDSHATGFIGATGRGTLEHCGVDGARRHSDHRRRSARRSAAQGDRVPASALPSLHLLQHRPAEHRSHDTESDRVPRDASGKLQQLDRNTQRFRDGMANVGFKIRPGVHPIVPVILGEAQPDRAMAERMMEEGVYVVAFSYPVVPKDAARVRIQMSAALSDDDVDFAVLEQVREGR